MRAKQTGIIHTHKPSSIELSNRTDRIHRTEIGLLKESLLLASLLKKARDAKDTASEQKYEARIKEIGVILNGHS